MKIVIPSLCVLAVGCATTEPTPVTDDPGPAPASVLLVQITDAPGASVIPAPSISTKPAPAVGLFVSVSQLEVQAADATWTTVADAAQRFDLAPLASGATLLVGSTDLAPGSYSKLRLVVGSASLAIDGVDQPITMINATAAIALDATLADNTAYALVLAFDVGTSLSGHDGDYTMTPHLAVQSLSAM